MTLQPCDFQIQLAKVTDSINSLHNGFGTVAKSRSLRYGKKQTIIGLDPFIPMNEVHRTNAVKI